MKILPLVACLLLVVWENDCDWNKKPAAPSQRKSQAKVYPTHRFELAQPLKDVAFDSQTGQLCRTWAWTTSDPLSTKKVNVQDMVVERKIGQFTPTCIDLYEKYPSSSSAVDPNDPLGILDDKSN